MSDTFLPGSGFDTYESQDKVLVQMDGSRECAVAVRILQQQGFAGESTRLPLSMKTWKESPGFMSNILRIFFFIRTRPASSIFVNSNVCFIFLQYKGL